MVYNGKVQGCKCCCSLSGAAHIYSSGKDEVQGFHRGPKTKGIINKTAKMQMRSLHGQFTSLQESLARSLHTYASK